MNSINRKDFWDKVGIYCIKNTVNHKIYIGSSSNLYDRIAHHIGRMKRKFHVNQMLKSDLNNGYSINDFEYSILEICQKEELVFKEQEWINRFEKTGLLYNYLKSVNRLITGKLTNRQKIKEQNSLPHEVELRRIKKSLKMKELCSIWNNSFNIKEKRYSKTRGAYIFISPSGEEHYSKNAKQFCLENNLVYPYMIKTLPDHTEHRDNHRGWKLRRFSESLITPQSKILVES